MAGNRIYEFNEDELEQLNEVFGLEPTKKHAYHITHDHLKLCSVVDGATVVCNYCDQIIRDPIPAYGCTDCDFYVHIGCEKIKEEDIKHSPFHRQHPLRITPLKKAESRDCRACTKPIGGASLSCSTGCRFDLHLSCIKPPKRVLNHRLGHKHSMFYFSDKSLRFMKCSLCRQEFEGPFYRCVECDKNFHVKCARLPRVVKNDERHHHPVLLFSSLQLVYDGEEYTCDICGDERGNSEHHAYYCDHCNFFAHVECTLHDEDNTFTETQQSPESPEIEHQFHQHPLSATCAQHEHTTVTCKACTKEINGGINYACSSCSFALHFSCATKPPKRTLKRKCHKHPLFYFADNGGGGDQDGFSCQTCSNNCGGGGGFYRCPECDANFHVDCLSLPRVVVLMEGTSYQLDFLLLDLVLANASDEHLCVFCKKKINVEDHVYYSQDHNIFAHIECLLKEGSIMSTSENKLLSSDPDYKNSNGGKKEADTNEVEDLDADSEMNTSRDDSSFEVLPPSKQQLIPAKNKRNGVQEDGDEDNKKQGLAEDGGDKEQKLLLDNTPIEVLPLSEQQQQSAAENERNEAWEVGNQDESKGQPDGSRSEQQFLWGETQDEERKLQKFEADDDADDENVEEEDGLTRWKMSISSEMLKPYPLDDTSEYESSKVQDTDDGEGKRKGHAEDGLDYERSIVSEIQPQFLMDNTPVEVLPLSEQQQQSAAENERNEAWEVGNQDKSKGQPDGSRSEQQFLWGETQDEEIKLQKFVADDDTDDKSAEEEDGLTRWKTSISSEMLKPYPLDDTSEYESSKVQDTDDGDGKRKGQAEDGLDYEPSIISEIQPQFLMDNTRLEVLRLSEQQQQSATKNETNKAWEVGDRKEQPEQQFFLDDTQDEERKLQKFEADDETDKENSEEEDVLTSWKSGISSEMLKPYPSDDISEYKSSKVQDIDDREGKWKGEAEDGLDSEPSIFSKMQPQFLMDDAPEDEDPRPWDTEQQLQPARD